MKNKYVNPLILVGLLFCSMPLLAQNKKNTFGIGFQSSLPVFGLSAKYALSKESVVQATIAPFGIGSFGINYFGGRYIYRFESKNNIDPYVYGALGVVTYSSAISNILGNKTNSFGSYGVGGGIEYVAAEVLGLSAEIGLGKLSVVDGLGYTGINLGLGIHYYLK
jgi:hypothetical protein